MAKSRRERILEYAAGIGAETAWILGVSALAFLMAIVALAVFR